MAAEEELGEVESPGAAANPVSEAGKLVRRVLPRIHDDDGLGNELDDAAAAPLDQKPSAGWRSKVFHAGLLGARLLLTFQTFDLTIKLFATLLRILCLV
jgi:hypothetical protein